MVSLLFISRPNDGLVLPATAPLWLFWNKLSGSLRKHGPAHCCWLLFLACLSIPIAVTAQAPPSPRVNYRVVSPTERPPAANPADGIALIEAPSASPLGGANLGYPIKLPPARKGHAPLVDLSYSSDLLHGWLGRGWDLSLPSIDVETRWGVPQYHPDIETETYLLEGAMLAPVAHRGESRPRTAELTFNPRVESEFRRITRHGDAPRNYWWEVAYPDGLVEYYGGTPDGLVASAQVRTPNGSIASWALVLSTDAFGNRIEYSYTSQTDNGRSSSNEVGTNRYPDRITYDGFGTEAGPFEVRFIRDRQLGESRRPDVRMEFTSGLKQVTADLLRRIEIRFQSEMVRHYELSYQTGAFRQSLLTRIAEFGNDGSLLAAHEMDYHGLPEDFSAFGAEETWNTGTDNVEGNILNPIPGFTGEISALGGAGSTSRQIGSAVTVGPIGPPGSKELTVGGTVGSGSSDANGLLAFVDINGDLLPDKLFKRGNDLVWRRNRFGEGLTSFGPVRPVNGIRDFSVVTTSEFNFGFEANITPFFAGYENTTARTSTTTYFSDFNGDDLLDILHRGKVYFNHLDGNGNPTFTLNSGDTPSPIIDGAAPDGDLVTIDPDEQQELIDMTPRHDVVRSWEAPYSGTISIGGTVQLTEQPGIDEYAREDGVKVTVELGQLIGFFGIPNQQLFAATIPANDYAPRNASLSGVPVVAGQRIYFRVQSIFDGAFDRVNWDPVITYDGENLEDRDVNGLTRYRYQASEDFLLASCQTVAMPLDGQVDLLGTFNKPALSDTLYLELLRGGIVIYSAKFDPDSVADNLSIEFLDFTVAEDQQLQLRMRSNSSIDWTAPDWTPRLVYRSASDGTPVISSEGTPLYSYCPAIDYTVRSKTLQKAEVWLPPTDSVTYQFNMSWVGGITTSQAPVTLTFKGVDTTFHRCDTLVFNNIVGAITWSDTLALPVGDTVWVELFGPANLENALLTSTLIVNPTGQNTPDGLPLTRGIYRKRTTDELIFGPQYRGWGQFVYRGEGGTADIGIIESNLALQNPDVDEEDIEDIEIDPDNPDFSEFEGLTDDPTQEPFVVMVADPKAGNWRGYDELTLVGRNYQSSSRLGEDDVLLTPDLGTGAAAPPLTSIAKINAVSVGAGFGPASLAGSTASNTTRTTLEVMDLNGDRYPDLVTPTRAQYTTVYGGLSNQSTTHGFGSHEARSRAVGGTAGGKFVDSSPTNSGDASGKGSRKRHRRAKTTSKNQGAKAQSANESAEAGGSISVNFAEDTDYTVHSWLDINGDGLADKVWDNGDVAFNYGYRFGAREAWGFADIRRGISRDFGAGAGINVSNNSFAAGIAITRTDNYTTVALQDVNGDGMADALSYDPDTRILRARLNTGTGFAGAVDWARLSEPLDKGDATAESANFAFTVCIPIFFIRICVNPSGSTGRGVSRVLSQLNDVDGDGYLDELMATRDNQLKVRRSTIGKANLLSEVRRPLGATIALDYQQANNDYGLPFAKWLLEEVQVNDGVDGDGPQWRKTRFSYEAPNHDRHEREFYGFAKTMETQLDTDNGDAPYRSTVVEYANDNFYNRSLPLREYTEDAAGNRFRETVFTYQLLNPNTFTELPANLLASDQGRAYPQLTQRTSNYYEGASSPQLTRRVSFTYDTLGQVLTKIDYGNERPEDEMRTEFTYHTIAGRYQMDRIESLKIYGGGALLRRTEMDIDGRGNVTQLRQFLDENTYAQHDFTYDAWSNVLTATDPPNANGERMSLTYEIDSVVHQYTLRMEDSYGYHSTASYDYRYGQLVTETDINGHQVSYQLDAHGRVAQVKLPKDSIWSFRYDYAPTANPPFARTERFDPETGNDIISFTLLDGLGRVIQTQYPMVISGSLRAVASGQMSYDAFDRPIAESYPAAINTASGNLSSAPAASPTSRSAFDILDRTTSLTMPDNSTSTMEYGFAAAPATGEILFQERMTDALGFTETTLVDERGQQEAYLREADTTTITTLFDHNVLGELRSVTDAGGFTSRYEYDRLGRKFAETPADGGRTEMVFDLADNVVRKHTPNLRELLGDEGFIRYSYDHTRLTGITYPVNFQNKVEISYGDPEARFNRRGRVVLRLDASGGEEFFYDAHGETSKTIRTILLNESTVRTFIHEAAYDSWGRLQRFGYPDGEWTSYGYDAAGKPISLSGSKDNIDYQYINNVEYDLFGQVITKELGNGGRDNITFNPQTRRPDRLEARGNGMLLQDLTLTYNVVGNLEADRQSAATVDGLGGAMQRQFDYDPLHRLTEAVADLDLAEGATGYSYFAGYDDLYNHTERELSFGADAGAGEGYRQRLTPSASFPHQVEELGGRTFSYDANGNQLGFTGEAGSYRYQQATWDEEDRMIAFSDNGTISRYTYSADGERAIQSQGALKGVFTDGAPAGFVSHNRDYIAYISDFFTFTEGRFTKHYFLGDQRILSKDGTGEFNNVYWYAGGLTAGDLNYTARMNDLTQTVWNYYIELGLPPGPPTLPGYYGQPGWTGEPLPTSEGGIFGSAPGAGAPGPTGPPTTDGPPGPPTWFTSPPGRDSLGAGYGYEGYGVFPEVVQYYYHTDQLGNVTWITDAQGRPVSFRAYLPTGEILREQVRVNTPLLSYAFNGKEQDQASGLSYFGARYLEPATGLWLSLDPLADAFPGHNPYAFGLHNPLRFTDPDGQEAWDHFSSELAAAKDFARIYNERSIFHNYEFGANIYRTTLNGKTAYFYDQPATNLDDSGVDLPPILPYGKKVADIHTHSRMEQGATGYLEHSDTDENANDAEGLPGYVANPRGELKRYNPKTGRIKTVARGLPHDEIFYGPVVPKKSNKSWRRYNQALVSGRTTTSHTAKQQRRNAVRYTRSPVTGGDPKRKRWGWHAAQQRRVVRNTVDR